MQSDQIPATAQASFDRDTVRAMLALFSVAGEDFHYDRPNNYGSVTLTLWTGKGDPWQQLRGAEIMGNYVDGQRGSGSYRLNERAVDVVMEQLEAQRKKGLPAPAGDERDTAPQKIDLALNVFDDQGIVVDTVDAQITIAQASDIVDHAAQAIELRRDGKDFDAVLDELESALVVAGVIVDE